MFLNREASYVYIAIIVPASIIIPVFSAVFRYKELNKELKIISWYLFLAAFTNIVSNTLAHYRVNNMPVMHAYTLLEFAILSAFYKLALDSKWIPKLLLPAFAVLCVVNVIFFQDIFQYNTYTKTIEAIIIIFLAIVYFKKTLDKMEPDPRSRILVYVNSGLLLYFSGSFVLFFTPGIILPDANFLSLIWGMHATFLLIMYLLFATALWKHKK